MKEKRQECYICKSIEGEFKLMNKVILHQRQGTLLCQDCLATKLKEELPDPSTENLKYEFDKRELIWKPLKIKQACISCGRHRWLSINNQWKKKCVKCYTKR
ncbi:hypothetical protein C4A76_24595 [Brevibacillus laterosporus]|uniref:Uncharacterized protein n=1 Tax=Brevibacillus laterosporus TaxID=1465 RepID=A0AAP8Q8R7_BRELA|nr:hypothetical protein C4A76_24595 [Brevibacillus laterosporus]PPA90197.1 hypothetical protein C4A77_24950 [Brevibacillus laterosporus]